MNVRKILPALTTAATFVLAVGAGALGGFLPALADEESDAAKIQRGFEIAPVPLNLNGKDRRLVGLGSYIVNGVGHPRIGPERPFRAPFAKPARPISATVLPSRTAVSTSCSERRSRTW